MKTGKSYEFTIYLLIDPLGTVAHAYTDEKEAVIEMDKRYADFGEVYRIEPCSLTVGNMFFKRIAYKQNEKKFKAYK